MQKFDPDAYLLSKSGFDPNAYLANTFDPTEGMSGFEKFAAGAGKAVADTGRGLGQLLGITSRDDVAEARRLDQSLTNTGTGVAGNIAGNVAMALLPGGILKGASVAAKAVPATAAFAPALSAAGSSMLAPTTLKGAAALGAGMGLIQPSISTAETIGNTLLGGTMSAAIPALLKAGSVAKSAIEPFSNKGQNRIIGEALRNAAGGYSDDAIQNLKNAVQLVPDSIPTAAQAAANPGIAALERTATQTDPVAMNEMAKRMAAQNEARVNALQSISPNKLSAIEARKSAANQLYGQANNELVKITPELATLMERPSMQTALIKAQKLAAEKGQTFDPNKLTGQTAHYLKMSLDDLASGNPATGIVGSEQSAVKETLQKYLGELEGQLPAYKQARETYSAMSKPINQADIVNEIASKSTNALTGNITPAAYARALNDKTAQGVTNIDGATLQGIMDPSQMSTLNAIKDDLARANFAQTAGKGVGSDTIQKLAYSNMLNKAGLSNNIPGSGIIGRMADVGYKRANVEMQQKLAQALLDPKQTAALMESGVITPKMQALVQMLQRGGAMTGMMTPGISNASK